MDLIDLIVVAHPDDEALWFRSIVSERGTPIVWCYQNSPIEQGENGLLQYERRLKNVVDFYQKTRRIIWLKAVKPANTSRFGPVDQKSLEYLSGEITKLITEIKPSRVYTHNPWGEYGHSEHLTVHQALLSYKNICRYRYCQVKCQSLNL